MQLSLLKKQVLKNLKILILDDNYDSRLLLAMTLEALGAKVENSSTVSEAIELLDIVEADIIITDLALPDESGFSFLEKIQKSKKGCLQDIPVIAISGLYSKAEREKIVSLGFSQFIPKPFQLEDLVINVVTILSNKCINV